MTGILVETRVSYFDIINIEYWYKS